MIHMARELREFDQRAQLAQDASALKRDGVAETCAARYAGIAEAMRDVHNLLVSTKIRKATLRGGLSSL
jgi:hypothetical protein